MEIHESVRMALINRAVEFRGREISDDADYRAVEAFVKETVDSVAKALETARMVAERQKQPELMPREGVS